MAGDSPDLEPGHGVADLLERIGRADRRDRIAIVDDRASITFGALAERCSRFSAGLVRSGVTPGDRVMLCLLDTIDWPMAFLGSLQAGATPICADTRLGTAQYEALLRESGARLLIVSRSLYPPFDGLLQRVESLARVEISEAPLAEGGDITVLLAVDEEAEPPPRPRHAEVCRLSDGARSVAWLDTFAQRPTAAATERGPVTLEPSDRCLGSGRLCEPPMLEHLLLPALAVGAATVLIAEESGASALRPRLAGERPHALEGHAPTLLFTTGQCLRQLVGDKGLRAMATGLRAAVVVDGDVEPDIARAFADRTGARVVTAGRLQASPPAAEFAVQPAGATPARLRKRQNEAPEQPADESALDEPDGEMGRVYRSDAERPEPLAGDGRTGS